MWCERTIVGMVLAILAIGPLATGAVRGQDFAVLGGLAMLGTAAWVVRFWANPSHRIQWPPACWAVLGFVAYAVFQYTQADVEYVARRELMRVLVYGWLFYIVLNNLHHQETTQTLLIALLGLATLNAMYAVYQVLSQSQSVWHFIKPEGYFGRGSGTYICPNHLAGFLEMLLPIAAAQVFLSRANPVAKVFYGYAALVMLIGIGATISRGGWISIGFALLVFFVVLFRQRSYRLVAVVTVLVVGIGAAFSLTRAYEVQKRFHNVLPGRDQDIRVRPLLWIPAFKMWRDHPVLGVGPGHFDVRFPAYRPILVQARPYWAHNDYLNTLADWGLIGVGIIGAFLTFLAIGFARTTKYVRRTQSDLTVKKSDRAATVLGIGLGLLALLVHSFLDFNMQIPANAIVAVTLMASLTSHLRFATDRYWVTPRWTGRILVTLLACGTFVYLVPRLVDQYREGRLLTRSEEPNVGIHRVALLRAASVVEPNNAETVAKVGECHRLISWEGEEDWEQQIEEAKRWFERAIALNRFDPFPVARYGMCLDWQKRHEDAERYFDRALALDPNNHYLVMLRGWHEMQKGDFEASKAWFERSWQIKPYDNEFAVKYLAIATARTAAQKK